MPAIADRRLRNDRERCEPDALAGPGWISAAEDARDGREAPVVLARCGLAAVQADDVSVIDEAVAAAYIPREVDVELDFQERAAELAGRMAALD